MISPCCPVFERLSHAICEHAARKHIYELAIQRFARLTQYSLGPAMFA